MKIAIPTRNGLVDDHFGHCEYYSIYTLDEGRIIHTETLKSPEGCGCKSGIAPILAQKGITVMLAAHMGIGALNILNHYGIEVIRGCQGNVDGIVASYLQGDLSDNGESCHQHEGCHN